MIAPLKTALLVLAIALATPVMGQDRAATPPAPPWTAALAQTAPLTGQIREPATGRQLTPEQLRERLAGVDFVLLGERHDNPDHHRLQAWVVGLLPHHAVAFEMIDSDQAERLSNYLAASPQTAEGLGNALDWANSGWPDWRLYQPIAQAALSHNQPILAANLPPNLVRAMAKDGLKALPTPLAQSLQLAPDQDTAILAAHAAEIQTAHCGMLPERSLAPFALAQYARDAEMARVMAQQWRQSDGKTGTVLIAGAGHVRVDRGVPFHLNRMAPTARTLSLAFVETRDDMTDSDLATLPYDLVWLTARVDDAVDPCEQMRKPR